MNKFAILWFWILLGFLVLVLFVFACAELPPSKQRAQQGISRTMADCLATPWAQEFHSGARACVCRAENACLVAGLPKGCAWDDWALETRGSYPLVVGRCE